MTRRGSLAYYFAAWGFGCFFLSIFSLGAPTASRGTLSLIPALFYFFILTLLFGAFTTLLFGFVLRRIAILFAFRRAWHWMATGAVLAPALLEMLGSIFLPHGASISSARSWLQFYLLSGPELVVAGGLPFVSRTIPAGAATAWVLYRVHRAFGVPAEKPEA